MKTIQKKPYTRPCLMVLRTAPMRMLAASGDPVIRTTSSKVDVERAALVKQNDYNIWDDDWSDN